MKLHLVNRLNLLVMIAKVNQGIRYSDLPLSLTCKQELCLCELIEGHVHR